MATQDEQWSADSSSEATSTTDTAASQHARDNCAHLRRQNSSDVASTDSGSTSEAASAGESSQACLNEARNKGHCFNKSNRLKRNPCFKDATVESDSADSEADNSVAKPCQDLSGRLDTSEPDSSAASSSAVESGSGLDVSDKDDDASTGASTPGAGSSKGDSSDAEESGLLMRKAIDTSSVDNGGWSISEDCLLRSMKESMDNVPWAEIGASLGRPKGDVKARWAAIKDQPSHFVYSDDVESEEQDSSVQQSRGAPKPSRRLAVADNTTESSQSESKTERHPSGKGKGKGKATAATPQKWHKGQRNDKVAMENKRARSMAAAANEREVDVLSGEEASSESSCPLDGEEDDDAEDDDAEDDDAEDDEAEDDAGGLHYGWPEPRGQDARYLREHVYPQLYPSMIQPEADEFFGEHDCAVLAAVDSKYKRSRWLEMQANFYNVTGRMIPLYLIRDKCERAERDSARQRQTLSRRHRVEDWVDEVPDEDLEDPAI